jgi:hypothetical protein
MGGALAPALSAQQPNEAPPRDSLRSHILRTRDGSTIVGHLVRETRDSIDFAGYGAVFTLARADVLELRAMEPEHVHRGEYWPPDPNSTRLFFAPTGRMLAKGEGYFSDTYLLLVGAAGGVTSNFTMGGGMSLIPSQNPQNNVFYLTPKVGLIDRPNFALATGALVGFAGFEDIESKERSFGILYGVGSVGSRDSHLDFGAGFGYAGGRLSANPALMIGGATRVSRRVSLLTENYVLTSLDNDGLVSYGVRFFGEKLSVDLAFFNAIAKSSTFLFPGIPYVAFAVKF